MFFTGGNKTSSKPKPRRARSIPFSFLINSKTKQEQARIAEEAEKARLAEEQRLAEEAEKARLAEEQRLAEEAEKARLAEEEETVVEEPEPLAVVEEEPEESTE